MQTKLKVTNDGLYFSQPNDLISDLLFIEMLYNSNLLINQAYYGLWNSNLNWSYLLSDVRNGEELGHLKDDKRISFLQRSGVEITNLEEVNHIVKARAKRFKKESTPISEVLTSPEFEQSKQKVRKLYGQALKDGSRLFDYQIETAALIVHNRRLLNANDTGTGKTRTTLVGLTSDLRNKKILIVTMSRNLFDWKREMKILGLEDDYIQIKSANDLRSTKRIHLVSYEAWANETIKYIRDEQGKRYTASRKPETCPSCSAVWDKKVTKCECGFDIVESIKKPLYRYFNRSYDACAIDEGHYIKNGHLSRAQSILAIKTKTRVLLSGTPAENSAKDLYWLLVWLIGDRLTFSPHQSDVVHFKPAKKGESNFKRLFGGTDVSNLLDSDRVNKRASNLDELWKILDTVMYRKRKTDADVAQEIKVPEPNHRRIHVEMIPQEREVYETRLKEFNEWYKSQIEQKKRASYMGKKFNISSIEVCAWLDKLRKVTSCPWVQPEYDSSSGVMPSKLAFTRDKIVELNHQKKKMLIFTAHKETAEQLGVLLDEFIPGVNAAFIHGSVSMEYREHLMERFQDENDPLRILVMTYRTGAESYTLTEAKAVILYDLDFNPKKVEQAYSRAVRLGQKSTVEIIWLINVDTIDANMHALILSKKAGVDLAIDRVDMDFEKLAQEFEGNVSYDEGIDYIDFAEEMLKRGVKRSDYREGTA